MTHSGSFSAVAHLWRGFQGRLRGEIQFKDSFGSIWFRLLPAARLRMRPGWSRLALRSLRAHWATLASRWPRLASSGVAKLLIRFHFLPFPTIPTVDRGDGGLGCEVPAFAGTTEPSARATGGVNPGLIWPCLASFTPSRALETRPRVASLVSLVASSGVRRSGKTFKFRSFPIIPLVDGGDGSRDARFAGFTNEVQHQIKVLPWDTHRSPLRNGVRLPAYVPRAPRSGKSLQVWIARHRRLLGS